MSAEKAGREAPLIVEAQEMLRQWEAGEKKVTALWQKMNQWVYDGFDITYDRLGVSFDKIDMNTSQSDAAANDWFRASSGMASPNQTTPGRTGAAAKRYIKHKNIISRPLISTG